MTQMPLLTLLIQIAMTGCIITYASIYFVGILKSNVKPILATWIFMSLATVLSFLTDFSQSGITGVLANSFNTVDTLATLIISAVILCTKDIRKKFTGFEAGCLSAVILVFIGWLLSGQNIVAHIAIQIILVIAYLPTLFHLWKASKNTESVWSWSFDSLASMLGIIEPLRTMDLLPLVYVTRSIVSTLAVIVLILRLKLRKTSSI